MIFFPFIYEHILYVYRKIISVIFYFDKISFLCNFTRKTTKIRALIEPPSKNAGVNASSLEDHLIKPLS